MIIATEDRLGEAVLRKLLAQFRPTDRVVASIGGRGKAYLQGRASELNRTALHAPVVLLIDLDKAPPCPGEIAAAWFPNGISPRMLFRIAVFEIESWLLADRRAMSNLLAVPQSRIPLDTDSILDPKEFLVNLARRSRVRATREELVPDTGSLSKVGLGYNSRLEIFIETAWDPHAARHVSDSLNRFINRLAPAPG